MTTVVDPKVGVTYRTVLLKAADITRQVGHCANAADGPDGSRCVQGLLMDAAIACDATPHIWLDAQRALERAIGGESPIVWNYRQTAASVIETFERAALSKGKS